MKPTARRTCALALGAALALTAAPAPAAADGYPGYTASRYTPLTGGAADLTGAEKAGCAEGEVGRSGPRVLFFGTQQSDGRLRQPGTSSGSRTPRSTTSHAVAAATAWAEGFTACSPAGATAELALGVNNKQDGGASGSGAGRDWAQVVETAAEKAGTDKVRIAGAVDAEPSWSSARWARDWVDAYTTATGTRLYAVNSADSCPEYGSSSTSCANGWKLSDVHYVATGASGQIRAIPQIYRTNGTQARQWAAVSAWGARHSSGPVRFVGSMSQRTACNQRGGCNGTNNTAKTAWTQLRAELNAHEETRVGDLPYASDMRWP
ncbi:hypothetical protein [Nocardiopsis potens]|uniref:hypothetical protein n=1 Tax=Nocardiopsis potens TaxID=1246458 RepID=UPI000344E4E3|nr:hypothetical protein [Nocardiopsis potens]